MNTKLKKIITVLVIAVFCLVIISAIAMGGRKRWKDKAESECAEVIFDLYNAINHRDADKIDSMIHGRVPIDAYNVYYDREGLDSNLKKFNNIISQAYTQTVAFKMNQVCIRVRYVYEGEDNSGGSEAFIMKKVNGEWKIIEIHGEGSLSEVIFARHKGLAKTVNASDIHFWDFPSGRESSIVADNERLR